MSNVVTRLRTKAGDWAACRAIQRAPPPPRICRSFGQIMPPPDPGSRRHVALRFSAPALIGSALLGVSGLTASAQTSTTLSQTVNKRNTIGALTAAPSTGLTAGASVTFSYTLHTAGAPAPTTETVQFMDGSNAIGSAQTIGSVSASNILPYSQISAANNWTTTGTAPALTPNSVTGPDGSASTATQVAFPSTTSTPLRSHGVGSGNLLCFKGHDLQRVGPVCHGDRPLR